MKRILKYLSLVLCLVVALSSCDDDLLSDYDTRDNEYDVYYYVTYSTVYDFHNIAYVSFTDFFDPNNYKYTGFPNQIERSIDETSDHIHVTRAPRGAHLEFSTYVDVPEALPNTKAEISICISKGSEIHLTEVAKAVADCPLKGNPLTISYDIPNQ